MLGIGRQRHRIGRGIAPGRAQQGLLRGRAAGSVSAAPGRRPRRECRGRKDRPEHCGAPNLRPRALRSVARVRGARRGGSRDLDLTFSADVKTRTEFFGTVGEGRGIDIQADGKIVVAGLAGDAAGNGGFGIARYHPNGAHDDTFSADGKTRTDFGPTLDGGGGGGGPARREDRGRRLPGPRRRRQLRARPVQAERRARRHLLGRREDDDGLRGGEDEARGVVLQPDGKIVAAGLRNSGTAPSDFALARYLPNGALDDTLFGRRQDEDRLRGTNRRSGRRHGATGRQARRRRLHRGQRGAHGLRARALQAERRARPLLRGRRQADHRLRERLGSRQRGRAPAGWQDRRRGPGRRSYAGGSLDFGVARYLGG
jgi:uncharacterized delta-60 repeat protein